MENKKDSNYEEVTYSFTYQSIEDVLTAESSYIARSLYDVAVEKPMVTSFILAEDDKHFIVPYITKAFVDIVSRLSAYAVDGTQYDDEPYVIVLKLPVGRKKGVDSLIMHELQRAVVAYILWHWYENRLPDVAMRQHQIYDASVAMALHDVYLACGGMRRRGSYF